MSEHIRTNIEMHEILQRRTEERRAAIESDGCCNELGPNEDGSCRAFGMCPLYLEARSLCNRLWKRGPKE